MNAKPRILVVEDNAVVRFVAVKTLRSMADVDIHSATTGVEALKAVSEYDYALILMDIHMPEMDGIAATKLIRDAEIKLGKRTPIIAVTASEGRASCLEAGMDDFVSKPADYRRIVQDFLPTNYLRRA